MELRVDYYFHSDRTHLMAMYRQIASVTVKEIEIVCSTCVKCMWKSR